MKKENEEYPTTEELNRAIESAHKLLPKPPPTTKETLVPLLQILKDKGLTMPEINKWIRENLKLERSDSFYTLLLKNNK